MRYELIMLAVLIVPLLRASANSQGNADCRIDAVPAGYYLHSCDDCGIDGRQPHIDMADCYNFTFATSDTDADLKSRSAVFSYKEIRVRYDDLDPALNYVLKLTYASDHVYKRVQSLWAGEIQLHEPMALPNAKAIPVVVKIPASAIEGRKLALTIKIHGEVNATASIIELYADAKPKSVLRLQSLAGTPNGLAGRVLDLGYEGVPNAGVQVTSSDGGAPIAATKTGADGAFSFALNNQDVSAIKELLVVADSGGEEVMAKLPSSEIGFAPVRYRPMPARVQGLAEHQISLDGPWKIDPAPSGDSATTPLDRKSWSDFSVPGQWKQQGFDVPQDRTVAMAREFVIPKEWKGYRVILRFDAIHAGVTYRLNGKVLGYSENLYTPVEWDITDAARPGLTNRLDLSMKVATDSERLSYSSGYAFHSLGGIDRSVRLFPLPKVHVRDLRILTDLDGSYRDAEIKLSMTVVKPSGATPHFSLTGPDGKPVRISVSPGGKGSDTGEAVTATIRVTDPRKWTAETPALYKLSIELLDKGTVLESIERSIGFRKIELRDSQLYLNGRRIKLAGACHHEFDPVTGRAGTMRHAEEDVRLAKEANLNYLRTSHYPPTEEFLDACDRLGVYVEAEAPFCWVQPSADLADLRKVLEPTSAMVDFCHSHPSVVLWSLANESNFNECFKYSDELAKKLDPTRPTTFNNPDPERICSIANLHYPLMPYDDAAKDDPRPLLLGEYFFPVCHEQTDVSINPGLRELWGHGQAEPDSAWARSCADNFRVPRLMPGLPPGTWSYMYHSDRVIGGAIWALIDEPFYFKDGTHCGYAWHHGFWGIIDAWRRPKPEFWLAKMIFSPVWFPTRHVPCSSGQKSVTIPVENRYSFTDLAELDFTWEIGNKTGKLRVSAAPGKTASLIVPLPEGVKEGDKITIAVTAKTATLINLAAIILGQDKRPLPPASEPTAGAPEWSDDGKTIAIDPARHVLSLDKKTALFAQSSSAAPVLGFPVLHITRYDYGDLNGPNSPPYAIFPDAKTRVIDDVSAVENDAALQVTVKDHYEHFAGFVRWTIDKNGSGRFAYEYTYTGPNLDTREVGLSILLDGDCDALTWKRWSEWGDFFPPESITRTAGTARARRDSKWPEQPDYVEPDWPWSQDQTELGTNDFRSGKFCVYAAAVSTPDGRAGLSVTANADAHVRACLADGKVKFHMLKQCSLAPVVLKSGDRLTGEFSVSMWKGESR